MSKLIYNPNLTIDLPTNENKIKSKAYLPGQIKKKIDKGVEIKLIMELKLNSFGKISLKMPIHALF